MTFPSFDQIDVLSSEGTSHSHGDARQSIREVGAAPGSDLDALALLQGEDAVALALDLVRPAGPDGRAVDERGFADG
jgi:hypothetical protein